MRRATHGEILDAQRLVISIHALHEESDRVCVPLPTFTTFQSTLSMRRATGRTPVRSGASRLFQSTLSMRRATGVADTVRHLLRISIHALHEESDSIRIRHPASRHISIHALHEESDTKEWRNDAQGTISIHALHEESDRSCSLEYPRAVISIHALHEESDSAVTSTSVSRTAFQSTLSMRRATRARRVHVWC